MEIIPLKEAKKLGLKRYFTGKPCKYGHVSERFTSARKCIECGRISVKKDYYNNKEEYNKRSCKWARENSERNNENSKNWYKSNTEKVLKVKKKAYRNNPEKFREIKRIYAKNNPDKVKESRHRAYKKYSETPTGYLRALCKDSLSRLKNNKLLKSKLNFLDYSPEEFEKHILSFTSEFKTIKDMKSAGYEIDHIPIKQESPVKQESMLSKWDIFDVEAQQQKIAKQDHVKYNKLYVQDNNEGGGGGGGDIRIEMDTFESHPISDKNQPQPILTIIKKNPYADLNANDRYQFERWQREQQNKNKP